MLASALTFIDCAQEAGVIRISDMRTAVTRRLLGPSIVFLLAALLSRRQLGSGYAELAPAMPVAWPVFQRVFESLPAVTVPSGECDAPGQCANPGRGTAGGLPPAETANPQLRSAGADLGFDALSMSYRALSGTNYSGGVPVPLRLFAHTMAQIRE